MAPSVRAGYTRLVSVGDQVSLPGVCFVYVAYDLCGDCGWLYDEVAYSILSLAAAHGWHALPPGVRIRVFTDDPDRLQLVASQVESERLDRRRIEAGMGGRRFVHRLKLSLLIDAMEETGEPLLYLDGDTFVHSSLEDHLRWLAPGQSLMHRREGPVGQCVTGDRRRLAHQLTALAQQGFDVEPETEMYNAGAVGIHPADRALLGEALTFTDAALELGQRHVWEQLGISAALAVNTRLRALDDAVHHYWYAREAHHGLIAAELAEMARQGMGFAEAVDRVRHDPIRVSPRHRPGLATRVWRRLAGRNRPLSIQIQDRIARMADWEA